MPGVFPWHLAVGHEGTPAYTVGGRRDVSGIVADSEGTEKMKIDTGLGMGSLDRVGEHARRAEELGFATLWSVEAQGTPFLPLAIAAVETERIELGTGIAVAFARSPMVHAMTAWDLHKASKGRFILGLGTQVKKHVERRFSAEFSPPGPRMRDMLLAIRHIWDAFDGKHKLSYKGKYYTHDYSNPFFTPGPTGYGQPKLMIAAVGPYMCRLAGEVCDGMEVHPFHTAKYFDEVILPNVQIGLAKAGRSLDDFEFTTSAFALVGTGEQQEKLAGLARQQIAFYGSTPAYKGVFEIEGWDDLQPQLANMVRKNEWGNMNNLISDEVMEKFTVRADFADLPNAINERFGSRAQRVGFYTPVIGSGLEEQYAKVVKALA